MKPSNKKMGNHFESVLCDILSDHGWWAHNMAQNETGQPADVIAVKNNIAVLIDCKVCSNDTFPLSRVEGNQYGAMTMWKYKGNEYSYFACLLSNGSIYMVDFESIAGKVGSIKDFDYYPTLEEWLGVMK